MNDEREWRDRMNAALKAEREKVAQWMISRGYATGHGDTIEDLLQELEWQIAKTQGTGGQMTDEQEAILRFGIEIEKMLCEKLGKQWRPSGMSIESLVEEMSAKANAPSAYVHLPKDPDRFIALQSGDRLTIEARNPVPAPAVVRQLVDALAGLIDFIEIDNLKIDQDALRIARAALAAAREAGL